MRGLAAQTCRFQLSDGCCRFGVFILSAYCVQGSREGLKRTDLLFVLGLRGSWACFLLYGVTVLLEEPFHHTSTLIRCLVI